MPEVVSIGGKLIAWQEINERRFGPKPPGFRNSPAEIIKNNLNRNFPLIFKATSTFPHPNLLPIAEYLPDGLHPLVPQEKRIDWQTFRPEDDFDRDPVICYPYLEAPTLKSYLDINMPLGLSEEELVMYFSRLCLGCHHMHQNSLVHRDIHPGNILVRYPQGTKVLGQDPKEQRFKAVSYYRELGPKNFPENAIPEDLILMDYDLVGRTGEKDQVWKAGFMTVNYASPDQVQHTKPLSPTADIFSLGILFAHLYFNEFVGKPFPDIDTSKPVTHELYRQLGNIPFFRRDVKEALEGATLFNANYRYQDIPTFLADLQSAF